MAESSKQNIEGLKRRRVTRACDSCRVLKSKCDGQRPVCGRCAGYGYSCRWNVPSTRRRHSESRQTQLSLLAANGEIQKLRQAIRRYDFLIQGLRNSLPENDRKAIDLGVSAIQLPSLSPEAADTGTTNQSPPSQSLPDQESASVLSRRFLGEASDITFFNTMKQALTLRSEAEQSEGDTSTTQLDSYEQDGALRTACADSAAESLPPRAIADKFLEIYFSTIHMAYPFIWEPVFRQKYEAFWGSDSLQNFRGPWLSVLLTIFAIGACYETFADTCERSSKLHQHHLWFDQAVSISQSNEKEQGMDYIAALLAQCFYLLATCQTDRAWTTLGKAVRSSQSIGLHTEDVKRLASDSLERVSVVENRRRLWYSLYVLDRLLSLQLGRPPAIHDEDFKVAYPSKASDMSISNGTAESKRNLSPKDQECSNGEYFVAMIQFSGIIGRVFSLLYGPNRTDNAVLALSTIQSLDHDLQQWRASLPRALRFDLAHIFQKSTILKRQRNMLAIKFYNLQALIHRPLLSSSRFLRSCRDPLAFYQAERGRIVQSKKKCVVAAQHTARLLHNVADKKQLIYDFPWWQMISCLICATSILLVASLCMGGDEGEVEDIDWLAVDEDADVCLTVFRELSTNSNAARLAEKMMQGLKETRLNPQGRPSGLPGEMSNNAMIGGAGGQAAVNNNIQNAHAAAASPSSSHWYPISMMDTTVFDAGAQRMPLNLSEPVIWSSQFVNAQYNPFFGNATAELEDL
ncbi:uncharacterized protein Z519_04524 [Cladophialophora bantiana CBS 173.52]|uniref:Zn(2)-C6 fungal-type domain-containing protein n=1 Tax=Cladophialophora bantiana (strain ATCC 10958 / CBS 173.52 / CDC B-1940 / NIH 8579) TaxID=1442370 RepID=A0A0D2HMJ1_CLAB1|nr:uncharacterized protein Z519_04524 [Cladophialophora bantiana CBS 173.52]KIW94548.1 hypothetical protein Z519_04524 [Cladophialophora bantiana CBS 173.52]